METRKVQVTGGSTYTVSLPKQWARSNGISGGSIVEFYPEEDSLLLTPRQDEEKVEGTLDIGGLEGEELTRAVVTMYVSGFDVITLETARVSSSPSSPPMSRVPSTFSSSCRGVRSSESSSG